MFFPEIMIYFFVKCLSHLTAGLWQTGPDLAPQNFLLSKQFRHLIRCKRYVIKICSWYIAVCLHFREKFKMAAWGPKRVVLLFPITKSCFELLRVHKSEDRGVMKMPYHFFVYICDYKSTNSWLGNIWLKYGMPG